MRLQGATWLRQSSLRTKLILMLMAVAVIALLFSGGIILSYEVKRARTISIQNTQLLAEITASISTAALVFHDQKSLNEYLASLRKSSEVLTACIYDASGAIQGRFNRPGAKVECPNRPGKDGYEFSEDRLEIFSPIILESDRIGTVYIANDLHFLMNEFRFQTRLIGLALLVTAGLTVLLSRLIQRFISAPILDLAKTARIVSKSKDYSIRVHPTRNDEIGILIDAFNGMLAQIERRTADLTESTQILQSILNSMGDGVVVADTGGRVLIWNAAARGLLGPATEKAAEDWPAHFSLYRGNDMRPFAFQELPLYRAMRGETVNQLEIYRKQAGRKGIWLSATACPLIDASGRTRGGVSVFRDITEMKHSETERERLLRETQQAVRIRDEFMSIASHELKTPLTPLRARVQFLQRLASTGRLRQVPPDRIDRMMTDTDSQITRLVSLIDDLLDVTRITSGKLTLKPETVQLSALVSEVLKRYRREIQQSGSIVSQSIDPEITGHWDRLRIEQVLINLLTNALKYGQGKPVLISARLRSPNMAELSVSDQGIGLTPDEQHRIFNRFERAVSAAHYGGLGLGLYIAHQIVLAHGGTIRVESVPGRGSTFTVELPAETIAALAWG